MALAAGFGIDLERCDPTIFEALVERLEERQREIRAQELKAELEARMGRG